MAIYPYPFQMMQNKEKADKTEKLSLKDKLHAWATGIGIVGGLFAFSLILGVLFMDYDPMTMVYNIARDFKEIFG